MSNKKHGMTVGGKISGTYRSWSSMCSRCNNPKSKSYKNYGKRGIKVCDRWSLFVSFLEDMGEKPAGYSIERIDNDGNYEPSNCVWIPMSEQSRNKRNSVYYEWNGKKQLLCDWSKELDIHINTLDSRIHQSRWALDRAFSTPCREVKLYAHNGESLVLSEWAKRAGIHVNTLDKRLKKGLAFEEAITRPVDKAYSRNHR